MDRRDLMIQKRSFLREIKKIDDFSRNLPHIKSFKHFSEYGDGLFGWGEHKVTGSEMNVFQSNIQDIFLDVNYSLQKIGQEFGQIYKTFQTLDSEYIDGILTAVENARTASTQALMAQEDIKKSITALKETNKSIQDTNATLSRTVEALVSFKIKIQEELDTLHKQSNIKLLNAKLEELGCVKEALKSLQVFQQSIGAYEHLNEVDSIWDNVEKSKVELRSLRCFTQKVDKSIQRVEQKITSMNKEKVVLNNKIKIAYFIGGAALLTSITNLVLHFVL